MEFEVYEGQITKIYHGLCYLMHQVIKRYRNVYFACEQVKAMLYKFLNLTRIRDTLMVWLKVIFEGFVSYEIKSLHRRKSH